MYNVEKYLRVNNLYKKSNAEDLNEIEKKEGKLKLSYVRVSSLGQKDDLERQKFLVKLKYPDHIIIEDIGSGINLNKRGIRKIIKLAISGKIDELVIAYKDRLARFGYELIEDLIKEYSNGKIIIINKKDNREPEEELAFDVLQIMNVFVAKMNGLRKYKIPKNVKKLKNDT
jgi:predicted site-specific integrase-resolvase